MSEVIYHIFEKNDLSNKENGIEANGACKAPDANYVKVFTHIGKTGEKFLCMKFNAVLKIRRKRKENLKTKNKKTSFELLQEIMDKMNEK